MSGVTKASFFIFSVSMRSLSWSDADRNMLRAHGRDKPNLTSATPLWWSWLVVAGGGCADGGRAVPLVNFGVDDRLERLGRVVGLLGRDASP